MANVKFFHEMDWVNDVTFRKTSKGVFVNATVGKLPLMQMLPITEAAVAPFGVSEPFGGGNGRCSLDIEVDLDSKLVDALQRLDARIVAAAVQEEWFGEKTVDEIDKMYLPVWRPPNAERPRGVVRTKTPRDDAYDPPTVVSIPAFDPSVKRIRGEKATLAIDLPPHSRVVPVVELSRVWHMTSTDQFGISLVVRKVLVVRDDALQRGQDAFAF